MPLAKIPLEASMTDLLDANSYTLGQLASHPLAAPYVTKFDAFQTDWFATNQARTLLVIAVSKAHGAVEGADAALDDFVDLLDRTLLIVVKNNRKHALYLAYFGDKPPNMVKRPVLKDELTTCRSWIPSLESSPIASLAALAALLVAVVAAADTAVAGKIAADAALKDFDTIGGKKTLIDEYNGLRKSVYGELSAMPHQNPSAMLPADFADRFFPHEERTGVTALTNPQEIQAKIDSMTKALGVAQAHLADVNANIAAKAAKKKAEQEADDEVARAKAEEAAARQRTKEAQKKAKEAKKAPAPAATPAAIAPATTPPKGT